MCTVSSIVLLLILGLVPSHRHVTGFNGCPYEIGIPKVTTCWIVQWLVIQMVIWIVDCTYHIIIPTIEVQILDIKKPETYTRQLTVQFQKFGFGMVVRYLNTKWIPNQFSNDGLNIRPVLKWQLVCQTRTLRLLSTIWIPD